MGSLIAIGIPLLSALLPLLLNKSSGGTSPLGSLWSKITSAFGNITGHPSTTVTGVAGSLTLAGVLSQAQTAFGCTVPLNDWKTWLPVVAPAILGALMGNISTPAVTPTPPAAGSPPPAPLVP